MTNRGRVDDEAADETAETGERGRSDESEDDTPASGEPAATGATETDHDASDASEDHNAGDAGEDTDERATGVDADTTASPGVPEDVRSYDRFTKIEGSQYERVNDFVRERTYVTAREWAIARLCADFRTDTGVEMTKIGENLPRLVPFMTDTYSPQAVNQARAAFEEKVRKSGATFLYGAMSGFFTPEELDDMMYEVTEVAKFLLEVEGVDLSVEEELEAEDRISAAMREVRRASTEVRHGGTKCPNCGHEIGAEADD